MIVNSSFDVNLKSRSDSTCTGFPSTKSLDLPGVVRRNGTFPACATVTNAAAAHASPSCGARTCMRSSPERRRRKRRPPDAEPSPSTPAAGSAAKSASAAAPRATFDTSHARTAPGCAVTPSCGWLHTRPVASAITSCSGPAFRTTTSRKTARPPEHFTAPGTVADGSPGNEIVSSPSYASQRFP
ncbi:MAG: hypothetical protein HMLKMBBP_00338 [Planctomycetes bacterium]|nr:hypothetical protein [Planctomycetota bacterium]